MVTHIPFLNFFFHITDPNHSFPAVHSSQFPLSSLDPLLFLFLSGKINSSPNVNTTASGVEDLNIIQVTIPGILSACVEESFKPQNLLLGWSDALRATHIVDCCQSHLSPPLSVWLHNSL